MSRYNIYLRTEKAKKILDPTYKIDKSWNGYNNSKYHNSGYIQYSEYVSEAVDRNIKFSQYISENLNRNISYTEYSESINNNGN